MEKLTNFPAILGRFAHVYALVAIIIGWVMFRSTNIVSGVNYIEAMFGKTDYFIDELSVYYLKNSFLLLGIAAVASFPVLPWIQDRFEKNFLWRAFEPVMVIGIFLLSVLLTISSSYNPFIYFNF